MPGSISSFLGYSLVENNLKTIKILISIIALIASLVYAISVFIYESKQSGVKLQSLEYNLTNYKRDLEDYKHLADKRHIELEKQISQNQRDFQLGLARIEVGLNDIATDLQFLKQNLITKGLSK